jgi:hypothetical protein
MPDLNIKGNIIDNFGKHLPTPIIDFVSIENDKLKVQVSLFFNFEDIEVEEAQLQTILSRFQKTNGAPVYAHIGYVLGKTYSDAIIEKQNIDIFTEFYADKCGKFQNQGGSKELQSDNSNFVVSQFNNDQATWIPSTQNYYDSDDNLLRQFSFTAEIPVLWTNNSQNLNFTIENVADNVFLNPTEGLHDHFEGNLTVFAFCAWEDIDDRGSDKYNFGVQDHTFPVTENIINTDHREVTSTAIDLMPNLIKQQFSDISYQTVFTNGFANVAPRAYFIDSDEVIYNKTPILAIDGIYYKQDGYTLDQIVETFQQLINNARQFGEANLEAQNIINDIDTTLQTYGENYDLLIRLSLIQQAFPEKSTATEIGRFYERYKTRFLKVNEAVVTGTPVTEKILRTSKVRDLRTVAADFWEGRTQDRGNVVWAGSSFNAYPGGKITALKIYEQEVQEEEGYDDTSIFVKNGYWFFDYEMARLQYGNLAQVFDINAVARYLGQDQIDATFRISEAGMIKHHKYRTNGAPGEGGGQTLEEYLETYPEREATPLSTAMLTDITRLTTKIEYTATMPNARYYPKSISSQIEDLTAGNTLGADSKTLPSVFAGTSTQYADSDLGNRYHSQPNAYVSYLALRGIEPLYDPQVRESYGVMAFEFQDVEQGYNEADLNQVYSFSVTCEDTSKKLITAIIDAYKEQITKGSVDGPLEQYYKYASEKCNYNNVDRTFNEFFSEGVMSLYEGTDPSMYPWVYGPVMYNFHRDILTNAYGGDTEKIVQESRAIAAKINPVNGNLDDLEAFMTNYKTIIDNQYTNDGSDNVWKAWNEMVDSETIEFGKAGQVEGLPGDVQYFPLPAPIPITDEFVAATADSEEDAEDQPVLTYSWQDLGDPVEIWARDQVSGGDWWGNEEDGTLDSLMGGADPIYNDRDRNAIFGYSSKWTDGDMHNMWKAGRNGENWAPTGFNWSGESDSGTKLTYNAGQEFTALKDFLRKYDKLDERDDNNIDNPWYRYVDRDTTMTYSWQPEYAIGTTDPGYSGDLSANNSWKESAVAAHIAGHSSNLRIKITWYPSGGYAGHSTANGGWEALAVDKIVLLKMQMYLPD